MIRIAMALPRRKIVSCSLPRLALVLLLTVSFPLGPGTARADERPATRPPTKPALRVVVDERVELMCILFRLAGYEEYNCGRIDSYVADVDKTFGSFRDHPAVQLAQSLRGKRSIGFDACMSLAVHVTDAKTLKECVPFDPQPATLDSRWTPRDARAFLREARKFAEESQFPKFFSGHRPLYQAAEGRVQALLDKEGHLEWFPEFFGERPGSRFTLAIALLNGPNNYGPRCRLPEGKEELYCILGAWSKDAKGQPTFDRSVVETVVHEFCHSYANPIIDRHEAELKPAGEKLYARVAAAMQRQAYGNWKTMLYESLVRACTIRQIRRHQGEAAAWLKILEEQRRQFRWIKPLSDLLGEYEKQRDRYPTLESFAPRIVAFFNAQAEKLPAKPASGVPKVVSISPANGASDVDPELDQIKVVFDRAMMDRSWSLVGGPSSLPKVTGKPAYDAARKIWTVSIRLKPESDYQFMLNSDQFQGFQSAEGVPLEPVTVRFKTGKRRTDDRN